MHLKVLNHLKAILDGLCILDIAYAVKTGIWIGIRNEIASMKIPAFLTGEIEKEKRIQGLELGADLHYKTN